MNFRLLKVGMYIESSSESWHVINKLTDKDVVFETIALTDDKEFRFVTRKYGQVAWDTVFKESPPMKNLPYKKIIRMLFDAKSAYYRDETKKGFHI
jgi:hypothetical protein